MARWAIMCWHWQHIATIGLTEPVDYRVPAVFTGKIELGEDGFFAGTTKDSYGKATITGKISATELVFIKRFIPDGNGLVRGAEGDIFFRLLTARAPTINGRMVEAGWKGAYNIRKPVSDDIMKNSGIAACMLYPLLLPPFHSEE